MISDYGDRACYHIFYHIQNRVPIDCVEDKLAVVQIQDRGQVYLNSEQVELRHVRNQPSVRLFCSEVPLQEIGSYLSDLAFV